MVNNTVQNPIFIVCLHRSGSTLLKNVLDQHSKVCMAPDELHLDVPFRDTFCRRLRAMRRAKDAVSPDDVVGLVYDEDIYGAFWDEFRQLDIPRERLRSRLARSQALSERMAISSILDVYREFRGKERVGAKYPVHVARVDELMEWFPGCRIIFLTRDPRGIIHSKLNDAATVRRRRKAGPFAWCVHAVTMGVFLVDYVRSARIHATNRDRDNWHLVRYEDLVREPEQEVRDMCVFCSLPYEPQMLNVSGKPSSHEEREAQGIHSQSAEAWKAMSRVDRAIIRRVTGRSRRIFGYE